MKKLSSVLAILASSMLLASCGCSKKSGDVTVTFWHTMGQANQEMLNRMISEFEAANPGVTVEAYSQGGYNDIANKINAAIPAGTTPTLSFCYPDNVASYIESGAIEELTSYINNEEYGLTGSDGVADFIQEYWKEGTVYQEEGTFSVPYAKSTEVLFYNASVFEELGLELPKTWDEMWDLCRTIKTKVGSAIDFPLGYDSDSNLFITMCEQEGIPYTSSTGEHYLFNNADAKDLVSSLKAKFDEGLFTTKGASANASYTSDQFTKQKILMSIGSTGGTTYNNSLNFNVGVAPLPRGTKNNHVVSQGPSICFFKRASEAEKVAAWKFYKHITNAENTGAFSIATGYEAVRTSARNTETYKAFLAEAGYDEATGRYISARNEGNLLATTALCTGDNYSGRYFTSPVFPGSDNARDAVGGILANVFLNTKTIDAAFDDAMTECVIHQ